MAMDKGQVRRMETTTAELKRLRVWFVVYYLFNLVVGTYASLVVTDSLRSSALPFVHGMEYVPSGLVVIWSLFVGAVVFGVALLLFYQLLKRQNWARIIMLIIAWVTATSSFASLFSSFALFSPSGWLSHKMPDADWGAIIPTSLLTNIASIIYAAYMIRKLQFDQQIKAEFASVQQPQ